MEIITLILPTFNGQSGRSTHAPPNPGGGDRESRPQIDPPDQSLDLSRPEVARPHPTSQMRHQTLLPQRALPRFQNRTGLRYTLSASGRSSNQRKVLLAKELSLIRRPDAPNTVRNAG